MSLIRCGLQISSFSFPGVPDDRLFEHVADIATTAEASGFDSLWTMDHFYQVPMVQSVESPMLEGHMLLAALAARTERARVGAMVGGVTYRNPALLAKMITTLDVISSGRAVLGLGAAWYEEEHTGYGFTFPPVGERFDRLEDALRICRAMFTEERPSYEGKYHSISGALNFPRPIGGSIPIMVGGGGEKRTLKLVAQYADACNLFGDLDTIRHKLEVLDRHCADVGRDPAEITKTRMTMACVGRTHEEAAAKADALFSRMGDNADAFRAFVTVGDPDEVAASLAGFREAGIEGLISILPDLGNLEAVAEAGEILTKALG